MRPFARVGEAMLLLDEPGRVADTVAIEAFAIAEEATTHSGPRERQRRPCMHCRDRGFR